MKVIILTAKYGMGHISASNSIKEDIMKHNSDTDVKVMDFYRYAMPFLSKYVYEGFSLILKYAKGLYSRYYIGNDRHMERKDLLTKLFAEKVGELVEEENPDVIISTFPVISQGVGYYKEKTGSEIPLITCITDVSSHYEWINRYTDKYMVPCDEIMDEMIEKGIPEEKISVYGIPVSPDFKNVNMRLAGLKKKNKGNKVIEFKRYKREKELLIMGGGFGILPESMGFYERLDQVKGLHTTIVTGSNRKIHDMLDGKFENITVLGYSDRVSELMEKADCVLTKPGGITVFEAIYSMTPVISFHTDLPNEIKNVEFIEDNGFGIALFDTAERSVDRIVRFIENEQNLDEIKDSMSDFVKSLDADYFNGYIYDIMKIQNHEKYNLQKKTM